MQVYFNNIFIGHGKASTFYLQQKRLYLVTNEIYMPLTIGLIGAGVKLGSDIIRGVKADKERKRLQGQLDELSKQPIPQYMVSPELRAMYSQAGNEAANPQGFSGAETAGFNQRLGSIQNTQYNNAVNRAGGQMGRFIGGVLNTQATNSNNQFAAQGEQIRRMNRQSALGRQASATSQIQNVGNMNTAAQMQRRLMIEQALGRSIAMQKQNIDNAWAGLGELGGNVAGYALGSMMGAPQGAQKPQGGGVYNPFSAKGGVDYNYNQPDYSGVYPS